MYECIDHENILYSIEEYCILKKENKHPKKIFCPFCNNNFFLRGEHSRKKTHFMHSSGSSCSSHSYEDLFDSKGMKKAPSEIWSLKFSIFSYSYEIFKHIEDTFNIPISTRQFIDILKKIVHKRVLNLKNITPEIIPYVWINELGKYNDTLFLYTNSSNTNMNKIWNLSSNKNIVLCIKKLKNNKIKRSIIPINNNFLDANSSHIPITFIRDVIPEIFQVLSIENFYEDSLIKELLSYV